MEMAAAAHNLHPDRVAAVGAEDRQNQGRVAAVGQEDRQNQGQVAAVGAEAGCTLTGKSRRPPQPLGRDSSV